MVAGLNKTRNRLKCFAVETGAGLTVGRVAALEGVVRGAGLGPLGGRVPPGVEDSCEGVLESIGERNNESG